MCVFEKELECDGFMQRSECITKTIFIKRLNKKRSGGHPKNKWVDRVKLDLTEIFQGTRIEDNDRWRGVVTIIQVFHEL